MTYYIRAIHIFTADGSTWTTKCVLDITNVHHLCSAEKMALLVPVDEDCFYVKAGERRGELLALGGLAEAEIRQLLLARAVDASRAAALASRARTSASHGPASSGGRSSPRAVAAASKTRASAPSTPWSARAST